MKKRLALILAAMMAVGAAGCGSTNEGAATTSASAASVSAATSTSAAEEEETGANIDYYFYKGQPEGTKVRTIITTDGEVDDMDSLHHILLYANDIDIAGIVYSASQFHWQGDGEHTLGEINPDTLNTAEDALELTESRPQEMGWIETTIEEYRADYENLVKNDPNYPTADDLLAVVKVGNVEFEGDLREDTEGSDFIKAAILDDDERPLYLQTWGGFNTTARALVSIHDEYADTDQWEEIYNKVCAKCVIVAHAQDKTWKNTIKDMYPDLLEVNGDVNLGYYRTYNAVAEAQPYFGGAWLSENIKFDHGTLMSNYHLLNDGMHLEGEIDDYQFGEKERLEFGNTHLDYDFQQYDWIGEGDSTAWVLMIPVGLRGLENPNLGTWGGRLKVGGEAVNKAGSYKEMYNGEECMSGDRWLVAFMQDWAARADWAVNDPENCNHAPVVSAEKLDITAKTGDTVDLTGAAEDPDGDELTTTWWVYAEASEYSGSSELAVADSSALATTFTVPEDAASGDYFNIVLTVQDNADAPMTRYAQVVVTVE